MATVKDITHAYIGYDRNGTPMELMLDDGSRDTARCANVYLVSGGRIERMTLEEARRVKMYERSDA